MANPRLRITLPAAGIAALLLALGALAQMSAPMPTGSGDTKKKEAPKQTLSPEVAKKLRPAQDALLKGDLDAALSGAKEGLEISTKPYDKEVSLRIMANAAGKKKDFDAYALAAEQLNQLDAVPADEKAKNYKVLAQIYGQQRNYEKAALNATKWAEMGGGAEAYGMLANIYLVQKDCKNGIVALQKSIEGRDPTETELKQENYCFYTLGDKPGRQAVMETLVAKFLKRDYLVDLMQIYEEQNADSRAMLNLFRFSFDHDFLVRESEFVTYAEIALEAGAPAEALKVLETGISKGAVKLIAPTDRNSRMLAQAKLQTAEDRKLITQLDKEARGGKSGEADVKVGLAFLGLGEYDKAAEAIERGLTAERIGRVKRVDDAQMCLGIAYLKLGKKDDAVRAFTAAQGDARMAKAATVWLQAS